MANRINFSSGSPWEPIRGYSRAVRVNDTLFISGTTATGEGGSVIGFNDPYQQTRTIFDKISGYLNQAGFSIFDVVQTRLFIADMKHWSEIARAHHEVFERVRPASSLVEVSRLRDPRLLVEIEAVAMLGCKLTETIAFG
jgi:enamine deaminase RidA (YjgF/YER057c/UK114 family)